MVEEKADVLVRLWRRAAAIEDAEDRLLLMEAAEVIETLRELVGIREEMELEEMEVVGRA